ncbi:MAG: hypothetical protein H6581_31155 [Bacteroidia bacterium]|nr:hypothetical protein [Bacteroidia bacterium]
MIDRNGQTSADWYELKYEYDIRGNALKTYDYKGRIQVSHVYSLANQPLKTTHLESGSSTVVIDASGRPLETRDAKGAFSVSIVDALMRPTKIWARDNASASVFLIQEMTYGDSAGLSNPENDNLKGQLYEHWDEAGYQKFPEFDFRGLPKEKSRQVIQDSDILSVISGGTVYRPDWSATTPPSLDTAYVTEDIVYDALGRVKSMLLPEDMDGSSYRKTLIPEYNYAGGLQKIKLYDPVTTTTEEYVSEIAYNARGQRILIAYGNGIMQRYTYDSQNYRLKRVRSEGFTISQSGQQITYAYNSGTVRQDLMHEYDLNGNIIQTVDASSNAGVAGSGSLIRDFTYDPLYRLLTATGREEIKIWDHANPFSHDATPYSTGSETNTRAYTRTYEYDALGNILRLNHNGGAGATFNRWFNDYNNNPGTAYQTSNLLTQVEYGGTTQSYTYDANGNMLTEGSSRFHVWDHSDQLQAFYVSASSSISIPISIYRDCAIPV